MLSLIAFRLHKILRPNLPPDPTLFDDADGGVPGDPEAFFNYFQTHNNDNSVFAPEKLETPHLRKNPPRPPTDPKTG